MPVRMPFSLLRIPDNVLSARDRQRLEQARAAAAALLASGCVSAAAHQLVLQDIDNSEHFLRQGPA